VAAVVGGGYNSLLFRRTAGAFHFFEGETDVAWL